MKLVINGQTVNLRPNNFPGGECFYAMENPTIRAPLASVNATIWCNFENGAVELVELQMLVNAIRSHYEPSAPSINISLVMPYLPYARQDRVCNVGEPAALKVVAGIINSLNLHTVHCTDIHSDVGVALIDRLHHTPQHIAARTVYHVLPDAIPVAPDAGSLKKVQEFAKAYGYKEIMRADKTRNLATGEITGVMVYGKNTTKDLVILDDICDGGRTFIELAKAIKKSELTTGKLYLYVTHGIFSKGYDELKQHFEAIFVRNLMGPACPGFVRLI